MYLFLENRKIYVFKTIELQKVKEENKKYIKTLPLLADDERGRRFID